MSFKNGLLENTRHGRNAGMTKLALIFTKERIELFSPRDAFLNMARNTCRLRLFLFSPSKSVVPRVHFVRLILHLNKGIDTYEERIAVKSNKFQAFRQALEEITQRQVISLEIGAFS